MRSIKLFKVMLSLLIVCSMLVGTFASCDIFSGNMNFNDHVEDKDDDDDDDDDNDDGGRLDNDETQKGNKPNREEKTEREDKTDREERPNDKYETDKRDDPWVEDTYIDWETDVEVSPKDECIGGGYHEYNSEKIEDECYTGFEDGKFVEHWAYLEYCHICGESICKRYEKYVYSDNSRALKERYEETYFYPQDGEMKISSTHIIEYAQAVSQYAGGKTYIYPVCESSIVYDGFANEKHYGKVEYRYTGNGCECVLVRTDESGRISESSPEIWHANWGEAYILEDPNGKCTDGLARVHMCYMCGEEAERENLTGKHPIVRDGYGSERYAFTDFGHSCSSYVLKNFCPCGEVSEVELNFGEHDVIYSNGQEIDGVWYDNQTYACLGECNERFYVKSWQTKGEQCNTVEYICFTFSDGSTFTIESNIGISHNETIEKIDSESSRVQNSDGSYTVAVAERRYCADCGFYLGKQVRQNNYTKDGLTLWENEYEYRYIDGDISREILTYERHEEYENARANYDPDRYLSFTVYAKYTYYNENGELDRWDEYTRNYFGDNRCVYDVTFRNSDGGEHTYTEESHCGEWITVYELADGSQSCVDGVSVKEICCDCGRSYNEYTRYDGHVFNNDDAEHIYLAELGAQCDGEFIVNVCACGEERSNEFHSECGFNHINGYGRDLDHDGYTDVEINLYTCNICGFSYTESWEYSIDENCLRQATRIYRFGVENIKDVGRYEVSYSCGTVEVAHRGTVEKTITSNGYILVERCDACNAIIREETVENYTANKVNYFYGFNGKLDRIERINEQIYYADVNGEYNSIPMCRMIEYYGDDGTVYNCEEYVFEYSGDETNDFCGRYTVTCKSSNCLEEYICEEGERHNWQWHSCDLDCVPGREVLAYYCANCGAEEYSTDVSHYGHDWVYIKEKGCYTCARCDVMSNQTNDHVILSNMTASKRDGALQYIIGYYNNYGENGHEWRISLVLASGKVYDLDEACIISDKNSGRLVLDASYIAGVAESELGLGVCDYILRATYIDTYHGSEHYVDMLPHISILNSDLSQYPADSCEGEAELVYSCLLCGSEAAVRKQIYLNHDMRTLNDIEYTYDADGNCTRICTDTHYCVNCDFRDVTTVEEKYTPWGDRLTYYYISGDYWENIDYTYDREQGTRTELRKTSYQSGYYMVYVYDIETGCIVKRSTCGDEGDLVDWYEYTYIQDVYGNYLESTRRYQHVDGSWNMWQCEYEFDEAGECIKRTETKTYSTGEKEVYIYERCQFAPYSYTEVERYYARYNSDGSLSYTSECDYEYNGESAYCVYELYTDYENDTYSETIYSDFDFANKTCTRTVTESNGKTTVEENSYIRYV